MGTWDADKKEYESINQENIDFAKKTVNLILDKWSTHPALHSIEPVNEPWLWSDLGVLKDFYRDVRTMMKERAPHLVFVFLVEQMLLGSLQRLLDNEWHLQLLLVFPSYSAFVILLGN